MLRLILMIRINCLIATNLYILGVHSFTLSTNSDDVHFNLYPFASEPKLSEELKLDDTNSIEVSQFKPKTKTVFIVHGFWPNITTKIMEEMIKDAYLESHLPYNFICVDWSPLSRPYPPNLLFSPFAYKKAVDNFPITSKRLAEFLSFLVRKEFISFKDVHIIGYSLAAHIAGYTGYLIKKFHYGERIGRISGLDPARPLFELSNPIHMLSKEDAAFVDVYHAAKGSMGVFKTAGHVDFYPNSGRHQPGCTLDIWRRDFSPLNLQPVCSHNMVVDIYANSISKHTYKACLCEPYIDVMIASFCMGNCASTVIVGEHCPTSARGQYYFQTTLELKPKN